MDDMDDIMKRVREILEARRWHEEFVRVRAEDLQYMEREILNTRRDAKEQAESTLTEQSYYEEIRNIADNLAQETGGDADVASERVHETVDGHQWIIYTHYNAQVLQCSSNEGAYFDSYGPLEGCESYSDVVVKLAFAAMCQDVYEELSDAIERWNEANAHE